MAAAVAPLLPPYWAATPASGLCSSTWLMLSPDARGFIEQAGFAARCELVGGSFFDSVPAGGDAYLLKSVLHDWYDADVKRILQVCHAAMRPDAVLLVIERLLAPPQRRGRGQVWGPQSAGCGRRL